MQPSVEPQVEFAACELAPPTVSLPSPEERLACVVPGELAWEAACTAEAWSIRSFCRENTCNIWTDHQNFYSWMTTRDLLLGIGAGSLLANTSMDVDFQDWYQDDVRSSGTDDFAVFSKTFGDGQYVIPAIVGMAVVGSMFDDAPCGSLVGEFGCRATRSYLVGAPPTLLLQFGLGASRPGETSHGSLWTPFEDVNAVSGHAFGGAVPFITAARMTDNRCLKGGLYLCSTFTAWSRVNDDRHYLSQACLGWWIAYLACRAVDETEIEDKNLTVTPIASDDMVGIGAVYRR